MMKNHPLMNCLSNNSAIQAKAFWPCLRLKNHSSCVALPLQVQLQLVDPSTSYGISYRSQRSTFFILFCRLFPRLDTIGSTFSWFSSWLHSGSKQISNPTQDIGDRMVTDNLGLLVHRECQFSTLTANTDNERATEKKPHWIDSWNLGAEAFDSRKGLLFKFCVYFWECFLLFTDSKDGPMWRFAVCLFGVESEKSWCGQPQPLLLKRISRVRLSRFDKSSRIKISLPFVLFLRSLLPWNILSILKSAMAEEDDVMKESNQETPNLSRLQTFWGHSEPLDHMGVSKNRGTPKTPQNDHF